MGFVVEEDQKEKPHDDWNQNRSPNPEHTAVLVYPSERRADIALAPDDPSDKRALHDNPWVIHRVIVALADDGLVALTVDDFHNTVNDAFVWLVLDS